MSISASFSWSNENLARVQHVDKASIQISLPVLAQQWFLNFEQVDALKKVLGPRYDPNADAFRLVRRVRKPQVEILDRSVVHDPMIRTLCEMVQIVKASSNFADVYFHDNIGSVNAREDPYEFEPFVSGPPRTEKQAFTHFLKRRDEDVHALTGWLSQLDMNGIEMSEIVERIEDWKSKKPGEIESVLSGYSLLAPGQRDLFRSNFPP